MSIKVAFITHAFPPRIGGGIRRIEGIYNILANNDKISLDVITVDYKLKDRYQDVTYLKHFLLKSKSANRRNTLFLDKRIKIKLINRLIIGWLPMVIKYIFFKKFDIIFSTTPDFSTAFIGYIYKTFLFRKSMFIIDYRDLFAFNPENESNFTLKIAKFIEKRILKKADFIIVTTKGMLDVLSEFNDRKKIFLIRNYISQYTIKKLENYKCLKFDSNYFHIGYIGEFNTGRNPGKILDILNYKIENLPVKLHIVGSDEGVTGYIKAIMLENKINNRSVVFHGIVERMESLRLMKSFNGLFLIINPNAKISEGYGIPGKLYDYIYTNTNLFCDMETYNNLKTDIEINVVKHFQKFIQFQIKEKNVLENIFHDFLTNIIQEE